MFHIPMSSPMIKRMLGLFACAETLLTENVAINATATPNIAVNGDLVGFIDPNFGRYALSGIWDLSPIRPRLTRNKKRQECESAADLGRGLPEANDGQFL